MSFAAAGDWRDPQRYERLRCGDRRCFAWEWLRRSPRYRAAWSGAQADAMPFGLLHPVDPDCDALSARPLWHRSIDRAALLADALPPSLAAGLSDRLKPFATTVDRHILLSDGLHSIRVDVEDGVHLSLATPRWLIDGVSGTAAQLHALRQLLALAQTGRFARSLHRPERRARRWISMLRVHDALVAGASYREIVAALFRVDVAAPRWRTGAGAPWRLRVQRLAAAARKSVESGPAAWLNPGIDRADDLYLAR